MGTRLDNLRAIAVGAAIFAASLVSGCGSVEVGGGLLDAVGLSTKALTAKNPEAKLADRSTLVIPPSTEQLPVPGSEPVIASADPNFPIDPETIAARTEKEQAKAKAEACRKRENDPFGGDMGRGGGIATPTKEDLECKSPAKKALGY